MSEVVQSTIHPPSHEKLPSSPVSECIPLIIKLVKHPRSLLPDSVSKQQQEPASSKCLDEGQKCNILSNSTENENTSPNCSLSLPRQTPAGVEEVIDRVFAPGLPNCKNTCYLNSCLQVLRYTPNFLNCVHLILSWQDNLAQISSTSIEAVKEIKFFKKLHKLYIAMKKKEALTKHYKNDLSGSLLKPVMALLQSFRELSSSFEIGQQHDSHEALLTIISAFSSLCDRITDSSLQSSNSLEEDTNLVDISDPSFNELLVNKKERRMNRLKRCYQESSSSSLQPPKCSLEGLRMFQGQMSNCIRCLECEGRLERTEPFTNLEVPIADHLVVKDTVDLLKCLCHCTKMQGTNKFFCDECHHHNEAQMKTEIICLPRILLLNCSWLRQSSNMTKLKKDCTKVLIPLSLKTSENYNIFHCNEHEYYTLYAVVLHLGKSTEGGHYVSFVRDTPPPSDELNIPDVCPSTSNSCCVTKEISQFKCLSTKSNRWLLFDDESVMSFHVSGSLDTFPYYDFLRVTATPCMIFYYK